MSTEDWMKANGVTQSDLINVYTAPNSTSPSSNNDLSPQDPSQSVPNLGNPPLPGQTTTGSDDKNKDKGKGKDNNSDDRNSSQDKKLTPQDIEALKKAGWDHSDKGKSGGKKDLWYDPKTGEIYEKPKNGKGPGEPIGWNIHDVRNDHSNNYVKPGDSPGNNSTINTGVRVGRDAIIIYVGVKALEVIFTIATGGWGAPTLAF